MVIMHTKALLQAEFEPLTTKVQPLGVRRVYLPTEPQSWRTFMFICKYKNRQLFNVTMSSATTSIKK